MNWNNNGGLELNFPVEKVKETLEKNRETHEKIFKEAEDGYRRKLQKELSNKLTELNLGRLPAPNSNLARPVNHLEEYDTAIEMLNLTGDGSVKLTQEQFNCFMRNKWAWMSGFLTTNSVYSATAASAVGAACPEEW